MKRQGFVLIAMLGLLVVTSSLALGLGLRTRARVARADMLAGAVRARAAARMAVLATIDSVSALMTIAHPAGPRTFTWRDTATIGGALVTTVTADVAGRIHINRVAADELGRFLMNSGISARDADIASQSIADWRDPDQLHRPRGAEADWYSSAGFSYAPPDGPVSTFSELRNVRGVSAEVLDLLATYGSLMGDGRTNVNSAPFAVLASFPGISTAAAAAIIARRAERRLTNLAELVDAIPPPWREPAEAVLPDIAPRLTFAIQDIEIRTRAVAGRAVARINAIAHHTGQGRLVIIHTRYPL